MFRGRQLASNLVAPVRTLALRSRVPAQGSVFNTERKNVRFMIGGADFEKLKVLRSAVAEEFDMNISGFDWPKDKAELETHPNYQYIFDALMKQEQPVEEACLLDSLSIFAAIDADRSGFLDKEELRTAMGMVNTKTKLSESDLDKLFVSMDTNHDGRIDYFEFEKGIGNITDRVDEDV
mmetsp:Transcript_42085/g.85939  ORF Transcript_42085/g.85939 Transcript_42085/m.85939 type:complete len:179 (-) Transcript_42085:168-704(-)|eukprot:CAMPEP_0181318308 /NCGR_PEP_ID=MMETSP1101-20121128/16936_1 /TAXON_ID=46948 /ORGANISM="Rhodomonas abbreviata, Strain Caron Lab Isolate" /LENGTH=178 /DNA_ID=CAMNT_0023425767 /DNA_START=86 /DNA_END=622 /DNA_ORIENTATION=+